MKINKKLKVSKNRKKYFRYKWKGKIVLSFWKQQSEKIGRRIYISLSVLRAFFFAFFSSHINKKNSTLNLFTSFGFLKDTHQLLVLMKLLNCWSSKSFFATLRRSLCFFQPQLFFTRIDFFHRKWIGFLSSFAFFWHSHR